MSDVTPFYLTDIPQSISATSRLVNRSLLRSVQVPVERSLARRRRNCRSGRLDEAGWRRRFRSLRTRRLSTSGQDPRTAYDPRVGLGSRESWVELRPPRLSDTSPAMTFETTDNGSRFWHRPEPARQLTHASIANSPWRPGNLICAGANVWPSVQE